MSWLYFRNRAIEVQLEAETLTASHPYVFIDSCWLNVSPYCARYPADSFTRGVLENIARLDAKMMRWPDVIMFLTASDEKSEELWRLSNEEFEREETYFRDQILPIRRAFETLVATLEPRANALHINRSSLDFDKPEDLRAVTDGLDRILGIASDSRASRGT